MAPGRSGGFPRSPVRRPRGVAGASAGRVVLGVRVVVVMMTGMGMGFRLVMMVMMVVVMMVIVMRC